jgi:hypothetical protein
MAELPRGIEAIRGDVERLAELLAEPRLDKMMWHSEFCGHAQSIVNRWDSSGWIRRANRRDFQIVAVAGFLAWATDRADTDLQFCEPLRQLLRAFDVPAEESADAASNPDEWLNRLLMETGDRRADAG